MQTSEIKHVIPRGAAMDASDEVIKYLAGNKDALNKLGVNVDKAITKMAMDGMAMDAGGPAPVLTGSNGVPAQFLQNFLPGIIHVLVKARRADMLAPIVNAGDWSDEEIIITALEHLGKPELYSDHGGVPLTSWNETRERRNVVRHELGALMTDLETEQSTKQGINSAAEKRAAVTLAFEILRNEIFFNGFDAGSSKIYGFLNDPNLPAVQTVATGAGSDTTWASKTVNERISDLLTAFSKLRIQSGDNIDPESDSLILALPSEIKDLMNESDTGNGVTHSVTKWLGENYSNVTVVSVPELNGAIGGENVFYLYAEKVDGSGTDDSNTIVQLTPERMRALNTVQEMKGTKEGYTNALAGCLVKRGYAVVRYDGV